MLAACWGVWYLKAPLLCWQGHPLQQDIPLGCSVSSEMVPIQRGILPTVVPISQKGGRPHFKFNSKLQPDPTARSVWARKPSFDTIQRRPTLLWKPLWSSSHPQTHCWCASLWTSAVLPCYFVQVDIFLTQQWPRCSEQSLQHIPPPLP